MSRRVSNILQIYGNCYEVYVFHIFIFWSSVQFFKSDCQIL